MNEISLKMPKVIITGLLVGVLALLSFNAEAQANGKTAKEVVEFANQQYSPPVGHNPNFSTVADIYATYDPISLTRPDRKPIAERLFEAFRTGIYKVIAPERVIQEVQIFGDMAILSYQLVGMSTNKNSQRGPNLAESVQVYTKKNGKWKLAFDK